MKMHPVGSEVIHASGRTDGQTDMKRLISPLEILRTLQKIDLQ